MMTLDDFLSRLHRVHRRNGGDQADAQCPAHPDQTSNSLGVGVGQDGRILVKCFAGCEPVAIVGALGLTLADLFPGAKGHRPDPDGDERASSHGQDRYSVTVGLTLAELALAKRLPVDFLAGLGVADSRGPAVLIPYYGEAGEEIARRYRLRMQEPGRFRWKSGSKVAPYGLERLEEIRKAGWALLVEGESDRWTAVYHRLPVIGIPGKDTWRPEWAELFTGVEVYVWQEPGAESFTAKIGASIPDARRILPPTGYKDLSAAHVAGEDVPALVERLKREAVTVVQLRRQEAEAKHRDLSERAQPVLDATDPLALVERALRSLGYGGDLRAAKIVYLAITSRLLEIDAAGLPVHLALIGVTSAGKSFTLSTVLRLFPEDAFHRIDAGSPHVLIYDTADLRHRAVIFSEADSLPAGEDNPCASAIRNLLQDHRLHYRVTVKDPETGGFVVRTIEKPGPSVLLTTTAKRLGDQLASRLFALDVPDTMEQIRAALAARAKLELTPAADPDPSLIAYQGLLQALAPWPVAVPFAGPLSVRVGQVATAAPRLVRDFNRLLSLIKAVALLRHRYRPRDGRGRILASVEDYATVVDLVGDMYEASTTGASANVRKAVQTVADLHTEGISPISNAKVADRLGISAMAASRRLRQALHNGWVVNRNPGHGGTYNYAPGDALPSPSALPKPGDLDDCNAVTPLTDEGAARVSTNGAPTSEGPETTAQPALPWGRL